MSDAISRRAFADAKALAEGIRLRYPDRFTTLARLYQARTDWHTRRPPPA